MKAHTFDIAHYRVKSNIPGICFSLVFGCNAGAYAYGMIIVVM